MLSVLRVHLPLEIPVVGYEITPYVLLRCPDGNVATNDVPESALINGCYMRYKWYRNLGDQKFAVCSVHPTEQATLQCVVCLKEKVPYNLDDCNTLLVILLPLRKIKEKVPIAKSYHCTPRCFSDAWRHRRA